MKRRILTVALILALLLSVAGCGQAPTSQGTPPPATPTPAPAAPTPTPVEKLKVAGIFPGAITDMAWNQSGYDELMKYKDHELVEVSFQENVTQAEVKDVIRNYATDGYDLIIGHDLYFTEPIMEVAPEFPDIMFGISGGQDGGGNVVSISNTMWESSYLAGALAGLVSKTGKIGIIVTGDGDVARMMNGAFIGAAKAFNPNATGSIAYTGSWNDAVKGKELAIALAKEGVDVIYTSAGQCNPGIIEGCKEQGIYAIGQVTDLWELGPDTVVASVLIPSGRSVGLFIEKMLAGTLTGGVEILGVKDGMEDLSPYHNFDTILSQDIKDKMAQVRQDLIDGKVVQPPSATA